MKSKAAFFSYVYDPENPTPNFKGTTLFYSGPVDNLQFLLSRQNIHKDVAIFTGAPLTDDVIIAGVPEVSIYVTSSIEYSDYYVRILDYDPSKNVSINICEGFTRVSPEHQPPKNDENVFNVKFELSPIVHSFAKTHQIMVQIASGAHPHWSRNPGTGEHIAVAKTFVKSHQQIFASNNYPSQIILPILQQ